MIRHGMNFRHVRKVALALGIKVERNKSHLFWKHPLWERPVVTKMVSARKIAPRFLTMRVRDVAIHVKETTGETPTV